MALIECKECGNEISSKAPVCPSCGVRRGSHPIAKIFLAFVAIVAVVFVIAINGEKGASQTFTKRELCEQSQEAAHYIASLSTSSEEAMRVTNQVIADRKYPVLGDKVTASIGAMVITGRGTKTPDEIGIWVRETCERQ